MRTFAVITITFLLFAAAIQAQQPPIRVLGSNGIKAVIDSLRPRIEKEVGTSTGDHIRDLHGRPEGDRIR